LNNPAIQKITGAEIAIVISKRMIFISSLLAWGGCDAPNLSTPLVDAAVPF